jgi:MazG family protein
MSAPPDPVRALLAVMARLRDPQGGCPWDRAQTFQTIAPYTLEEAYEVVDAIDSGDAQALRTELGDLLFQVVFHARMAQERGWFDFADVAASIHDKLVRRHPHVFARDSAASAPDDTAGKRDGAREREAALNRQWEEHKANERAAAARRAGTEPSVLTDVPRALPALTRASKLGKRAARVGFDWDRAPAVRTKVAEELDEIDAAVAANPLAGEAPSEAVAEELGDLLFSLANWGRHLGVDPEAALRAANAKFESRFREMERQARARGVGLESLSPAQWDELWRAAKLTASSS